VWASTPTLRTSVKTLINGKSIHHSSRNTAEQLTTNALNNILKGIISLTQVLPTLQLLGTVNTGSVTVDNVEELQWTVLSSTQWLCHRNRGCKLRQQLYKAHHVKYPDTQVHTTVLNADLKQMTTTELDMAAYYQWMKITLPVKTTFCIKQMQSRHNVQTQSSLFSWHKNTIQWLVQWLLMGGLSQSGGVWVGGHTDQSPLV